MSACRDCNAEWSGHSAGHCTACHQTFSSDSAADVHFVSLSRFKGCHDPMTYRYAKGRRKGQLVFTWNDRRQAWALSVTPAERDRLRRLRQQVKVTPPEGNAA